MTLVETLSQAVWWYLILTLTGLATLPVVMAVCRGLADRGLFMLRPAGLLLITLPIWLLGNLAPFPFTRWMVVGILATIALVAWAIALRSGWTFSFLRNRWRHILALESVTAGLFLGYVFLRGFNPDVHGTEKPMELAFLNAAIRSDQIPVEDPWFAGEPINYYYLGYVLLALPAKLGGIDGSIAFNLGLATTFALSTVAAVGLAVEFARRLAMTGSSLVAAGALAGFLTMLAGNLHAFKQLIENPAETIQSGWWDGIGWGSSRVVTDSGFPGNGERLVITEFPAFSWILGDLHPHVIAFPWLFVSFALAVNLFWCLNRRGDRPAILLAAGASGVVVGSLYAMNSWDVPIAALMTVGAIAIPALASNMRRAVEPLLVWAAAAVLTAAPFAFNYEAASGQLDYQASGIVDWFPGAAFVVSNVGLVTWDRTSAAEILTVHGAFLALIVIVTIPAANSWLTSRPNWLLPAVGFAVVVCAVLAVLISAPALMLVGVPMTLALALAISAHGYAYRQLLMLFLAAGLLLILIPEFIFIHDPFGDRMNTVFKLYFQAWPLIAIALSVLILDACRGHSATGHTRLAAAAIAGIVFVILATGVYAPLSAYRWFNELQDWRGVDGVGWIRETQPDDMAAIDWLQTENAKNSVMLEAPGCSYGSDNWIPHNRAAMATGIPTAIGWDGHQRQWRRQQSHLMPEIPIRVDLSRNVYEAPGDEASREFVEQHGIRYVLIGVHEVQGYAQCPHGPPYLIADDDVWQDAGWQLAFEQGSVRVWERDAR